MPFSRRDNAAEVPLDSLKSRGVFSGAGVGVPKSGICLRGDNDSDLLLEVLFSGGRVFGWLLAFLAAFAGDLLLGGGAGFRVIVLGVAGPLVVPRLVCVFVFPPDLIVVFFF